MSEPKLHYRMPVVFGPFPGPRQSTTGYKRNLSQSTSLEAYVTYRTTREAVQSMLPDFIKFQDSSSSSSVYLTVSTKTLGNLDWLGNRHYNVYSYFIHGVQFFDPHTQRLYTGTFLPVLWEDMADPIISGREELGFPKLYAGIDIAFDQMKRYDATLSWQGTTFSNFSISGLQEDKFPKVAGLAPKEAGVDDGLFIYRHFPSTGQPGTTETQSLVWVDWKAEQAICQSSVMRKWTGSAGEVKWSEGTWSQLPTLHHIIKRLAAVEQGEIYASGVVQKFGVSDFSSARKIAQVSSKAKL